MEFFLSDLSESIFRLKVNISRSADEITQDSRQQPRSQVLSPALRADSTCGIWSWCYIFFAFLKFRNQSVLLLISPLIYHFQFDHCLVSGRVYCIVQQKNLTYPTPIQLTFLSQVPTAVCNALSYCSATDVKRTCI